jgi:hypothetical protein
MPKQSTKKSLILIPKPDAHVSPLPGSGIVGSHSDREPNLIKLDYEGNKYGAYGLDRYWQRLFHAAARHLENYPTVAREYHADGPNFPFLVVGTFDYNRAVADIRARILPEDEAISNASDIDLAFKDRFEQWQSRT